MNNFSFIEAVKLRDELIEKGKSIMEEMTTMEEDVKQRMMENLKEF